MIDEKEYKKRRERFAQELACHSMAIFLSAPLKTRSNDTEYRYRQSSDFYYLTGFKEDNSALVFLKKKKKTKVILFVQKREKDLELWTGERLGKKRAKKRFMVDEVYIYDTLEKKMMEYKKDIKTFYYDFTLKNNIVEKLLLCSSFVAHKNIKNITRKMRLIKSPSEIALIKKAINISKEAHHKAMQIKKEKMYEYQLCAEMEYIFKKNGAYSEAYATIVAGGNNANTLHYINNDKPLKNGDLILIDAGAEYDYYASDITRTIPVNGKFTQAQKELYNSVLDVECKIIKMVKPNIKRSTLQKKAVELLTQAMVNLEILQGDVKELIKKEAYKKYYPHGIGHWMGLDVHDDALYVDENNQEIKLKEGMILTIEPGIYIDKKDTSVPEKYRGIGIRIEDDILVTQDGYENLSASIVKEIDAIESMSHNYKSNQ
ncbi:Xaa-Pro aminopeptidase [hydrothermal vent metagenome]|uniref:Xaa-Pro aminopeptidase n=1 Tax=hydrothermal vent metagenome TaxID=652676 RepID=A0A1W1D3G1_9ZZZZ